jgi:NADH dehydrogenase
MSAITTIAVTGASGFVGRHVVDELLGRGYAVKALVRDTAKAASALPQDDDLRLVQGDAADRATLDKLVDGCQGIVHLVGIIREVRQTGRPPQTFQRCHVEATAALVQAAKAAGISRFLHMSAIGVAPDAKATYHTTKYEAEQTVRRSGLDWTVFRPGVIHGKDGELINQVRELARGDTPPYFFLPYFVRLEDPEEGVYLPRLVIEAAKLAPVAVEDVAAVFAEALARPQTIGEVYNVVGPEVVNWQQFMEILRDELPGTDKGLPTLPVPGAHAAIAARVANALGIGGLLPFDAGQALMAELDSDADLAKLTAHLGIVPRPFRASLRAYASEMPALA